MDFSSFNRLKKMAIDLQIIVASTRPGRVGPVVADWFYSIAARHDAFATSLIDLKAINLPLYDEPNHPVQQKYVHEHTKKWAQSVNAADAYVFVTPEYNHGPAPALINALSYVSREWHHKPAAFISYGGISGGLRGVQAVKPILNTLRVMLINESVVFPMIAKQVDADGKLLTDETQETAAMAILNELARCAPVLRALRGGAHA